MRVVMFPSIDLVLTFSNVAFTIFGIKVYKYAVLIVLGMLLGLLIMKFNKKFDIKYDDVLENFIVGVVAGVIGARIYYVLFNFRAYADNLWDIFKIRDGGLAIYGGLIFGILAVVFNCKRKNINVLDFLDYTVPYIALVQCIGRWGNFFNVEAYGTETHNFFRMAIQTKDILYQEVHPTFLYESFATLVIFCILMYKQNERDFKGQILVWYLGLYAFARFFIEGLRIDSLMLGPVRVSQALSGIIFVVCLGIVIKNFKRYKRIR